MTVEASSEALIEKVRTAVTDGNGQYRIVDLPRGTYIVTFQLTGFSTVRREDIELSGAFTAPISVEMRVGALEETITVTGETAIVKHSEEGNHVRARVFAFGVGYDVNSRLLDKLARANFGLSQYVRPNEDIEASVSALYRKVGAPVMTDVAVSVDVEGASAGGAPPVNRIYPKGAFDLFAGVEDVQAGAALAPFDIAFGHLAHARFELFPGLPVRGQSGDCHWQNAPRTLPSNAGPARTSCKITVETAASSM